MLVKISLRAAAAAVNSTIANVRLLARRIADASERFTSN